MLTDDVGVIQHAVETVPNRATGYCTDDVARAFIVALSACAARILATSAAQRLAAIYLAFLHDAQLDDGRFHNFMALRPPLARRGRNARQLRARGLGARLRRARTRRTKRGAASAPRLLDRAMPHARLAGVSMRSRATRRSGSRMRTRDEARAYVRRALALSRRRDSRRDYEATRPTEWRWFENVMTYDNARLPEALIRAGQRAGRARDSATPASRRLHSTRA